MPRPNRTWFGRGEEAEGPQAPSPLRSASVDNVWVDEAPIVTIDPSRMPELHQLRAQFAAMARQGNLAQWVQQETGIPIYHSPLYPSPELSSAAQPDPPDTGEPLGKASERIRGTFNEALEFALKNNLLGKDEIYKILSGSWTKAQIDSLGFPDFLSGDFCTKQDRQIPPDLSEPVSLRGGGRVLVVITKRRLKLAGYPEYTRSDYDKYIYEYVQYDRYFECISMGDYSFPNNGLIVKVASSILGISEERLYQDAYFRYNCAVSRGGWWEVEANTSHSEPKKALRYLMRRCLEAVSRDFAGTGTNKPVGKLNGIYML